MIHHTQIASFTIRNLFSLFNTRAKTNHRYITRPTPLFMNELTIEYWNFYKYFYNSKYQNPKNKTKASVLIKEHIKKNDFRLICLIISQCNA